MNNIEKAGRRYIEKMDGNTHLLQTLEGNVFEIWDTDPLLRFGLDEGNPEPIKYKNTQLSFCYTMD